MEQPEQVEVKLLNYYFIFRRMRWIDESTITFTNKKSPQRVLLAHALLTVSGLQPKGVDESLRIMDALPAAIVDRVFRIWRGSFPPARKFMTDSLYCAPETNQYTRIIKEGEEEEDSLHDKAMHNMESKFDPKDIAETKLLNQKILAAARRNDGTYKGAVKATNDGD